MKRLHLNKFIIILLLILLNNSFAFKSKHNRRGYKKNLSTSTVKTTILDSVTDDGDEDGNYYNDDNKFVKSVMNITVKVGDTVNLKCSIDSKYENNAGVSVIAK